MPSVVMAGITSLLFAAHSCRYLFRCRGHKPHLFDSSIRSHSRRKAYSLADVLVLLLQALFFAHGGITTLGVNTITLGLIGPGMIRLVRFSKPSGLGNVLPSLPAAAA